MKEYRAKSKSDSAKDFYKVMNNSMFGKTVENVENRVEIKLGNEEFILKQSMKTNLRILVT